MPHRYLVAYRNGTIPGDAEAQARIAGSRLLRRHDTAGVVVLQTANGDDSAALAALRAQPNVEYVVHDRVVSAQRLVFQPLRASLGIVSPAPVTTPVTPAPPAAPMPDTYYDSPQGWAVRQVGGYGAGVAGGPAKGPWDRTMGAGVRIAILDSGMDSAHPDIAPNLAFNLSEINQAPATGMPSICDDGSPQDQQGHGTWVASLAAGAVGPGTGAVAGVAPAATLLNIKILERMPDPSSPAADLPTQCSTGQASGLLSWVIQGIEDAVAARADVISLSLGTLVDLETGEGAGLKATFDRVTYAAAQAGVVVIASAGNDGFDLTNERYLELPAQARDVLAIVASTNPACVENVAIGATCLAGPITMPYYSNFGTPLNALAAPGGSYPDGGDSAVSGWVRGACSSGLADTTDGLPIDNRHSFGCFNLGHAQYVQAMGTSASAPLAAGVAALYIAANPSWSPAQVIAAMRASASVTPGLPVAQVSAAGLTP